MPLATLESLAARMRGSPFQGYAYAYPHKTAYRALDPAPSLAELWREETRERLFLYLHVPFCEMRCGFCNLFTTTQPESGLVARWREAVLRQATATVVALGSRFSFARGALGGGTPTFLEVDELAKLFAGLERVMSVRLRDTPFSVEMSPATVTPEKLAVLRAHGMHRASLGVQSFVAAETRAAGRPQRASDVHRALAMMRASGVPVVNVDLIYGIPGQTAASWQESLAAALQHCPEEMYLYPLYVRPLTGLDQLGRVPSDDRADLYRLGRDWLLDHGYRQISMRLFRAPHWSGSVEPVYVCQEDGMIGLGPGARSYTRAVHYSGHYAVNRASIVEIVRDYVESDTATFARAWHGVRLDDEEQRRRYVIKSLLRADGLDRADYRARFGRDCLDDLPQVEELMELGLAAATSDTLRPTAEGLAWSDVIGPWLYSDAMRRRMDEFAWA